MFGVFALMVGVLLIYVSAGTDLFEYITGQTPTKSAETDTTTEGATPAAPEKITQEGRLA